MRWAVVGRGEGQRCGGQAARGGDRLDLDDACARLHEDAVADADRPQAVVGGALVGAVDGVREREPRAVEGEASSVSGVRKETKRWARPRRSVTDSSPPPSPS